MIPRFALWSRGEVRRVEWGQAKFPLDDVISLISDKTKLISVVSPNNPTGAVITQSELAALSEAAPRALIILDHAYVEFVDDKALDLTDFALTLKNVCVYRTLSKAWGLAGLRVGYVLGPSEVIQWLNQVGLPQRLAPSLAIAERVPPGDDP